MSDGKTYQSEDDEWEIIESDNSLEELKDDGFFYVRNASIDNTRQENLGVSSLVDLAKFIDHHDSSNFHIPSRKSWTEIDLNALTPSKIESNQYLKKLIRYAGIPSPYRKTTWALLAMNQKRSEKIKKKSVEEYYQQKTNQTFGSAGAPAMILHPPLYGASGISVAQHCLKNDNHVIQTLHRILAVLNGQFTSNTAPQIPDLVSFLLHYQSEAQAYYTVLCMTDSSSKYFAAPNPILFNSLIRAFLPKLWQHMHKTLNMSCACFFNRWFSRLFVEDVPFSMAMRVFDAYMHQGYHILFRVGLALLYAAKDKLIKCQNRQSFRETLQHHTLQLESPILVLNKAWKYKIGPTIAGWDKKKATMQQIGLSSSTQDLMKDGAVQSVAKPPSNTVFYFPKTEFKSKILERTDWNIIYGWIPSRYTIRDPIQLHRMDQEGVSLPLMYKTLADYEPTLVLIKSKQERIFGCYVSSKWRKTTDYGQIGTRECFLFTFHPEPIRYSWEPGCADMFLNVMNNSFSMGAGGDGFGLHITSEWQGSSARCATFKNEPLNGPGKDSELFDCIAVEVYGFE